MELATRVEQVPAHSPNSLVSSFSTIMEEKDIFSMKLLVLKSKYARVRTDLKNCVGLYPVVLIMGSSSGQVKFI